MRRIRTTAKRKRWIRVVDSSYIWLDLAIIDYHGSDNMLQCGFNILSSLLYPNPDSSFSSFNQINLGASP